MANHRVAIYQDTLDNFHYSNGLLSQAERRQRNLTFIQVYNNLEDYEREVIEKAVDKSKEKAGNLLSIIDKELKSIGRKRPPILPASPAIVPQGEPPF